MVRGVGMLQARRRFGEVWPGDVAKRPQVLVGRLPWQSPRHLEGFGSRSALAAREPKEFPHKLVVDSLVQFRLCRTFPHISGMLRAVLLRVVFVLIACSWLRAVLTL